MPRTLVNEVGTQITVDVGDVVVMRSGNQYLMTEVPTGGASGPADRPTGVGVNGADREFHDVMLDRIYDVSRATPGSRQLAATISSLGLGSNMPERVASMITAVNRTEFATAPRTAGAASAAGTGNS